MSRPDLDADEFVAAFAQHGRALWLLAAAWVGRGEASDLVQEVARVAWQRRLQFVSGIDLRAWLSQIARHLGANWRRRQRPRPLADGVLPELADSIPGASLWPFDADRHGLSDELARPLAQLSDVARASLLLHVVLGHSFAEIATMLALPENTVASHARRARLTLRASLSPSRLHSAALPEAP